MMKAILMALALAGTCILGPGATSAAPTPEEYPVEFLRLEKLNTGYMVFVREMPRTGTHWLRLKVRLAEYDATDSAHMAVGLGDVYGAMERGKPVVGDGFILGFSGGCPDLGVALNFESYGAEIPGKTLDCPTAYGPLDRSEVYTVEFTASAQGDIGFKLLDSAGRLLHAATRSWNGQHGYHDRGFFLIPFSQEGRVNGAYDLLDLRVGFSAPDRPKRASTSLEGSSPASHGRR